MLDLMIKSEILGIMCGLQFHVYPMGPLSCRLVILSGISSTTSAYRESSDSVSEIPISEVL